MSASSGHIKRLTSENPITEMLQDLSDRVRNYCTACLLLYILSYYEHSMEAHFHLLMPNQPFVIFR